MYTPTIGIEVHAELKTKTKMFCNSKNDPDEKEPNANICPVCMAHPGTLPTINKAAVKHVLRVGAAIGGTIADYTEFDRKNYFYPDLPKGYQISQYKYPLVSGGEIGGVAITRVHLEEDTARSIHQGEYSLVDFNRAGVPLMELVTEPVVHSAEEASRFAKELQLLLRYLGASDANMEKGQLRVEANISIQREDVNTFGTKVEVKNINSFKAVEDAIIYEIKRQSELLDKGEKVIQETRGWDENKGKTFSQRLKEESHDYRYFPDPDLPSLKLSEIPEFSLETLKKEFPELPWEKRERYTKVFGFQEKITEMFVGNPELSGFFEKVIEKFEEDKEKIKLASNYITSDLLSLLRSDLGSRSDLGGVTVSDFSELIIMIHEGVISSRGAKDILAHMFTEGGNPREIAEEKKLLQVSDESAMKEVVTKIIGENPHVVAEYKAGKEASLQYLIGQGMKETKGSANPQILKKLFIEQL